jgi:site-specific DNA recombinase
VPNATFFVAISNQSDYFSHRNMKTPPSSASEAKHVGIWIRVSTEDQAKGESPEHHLARAKAYALVKGWNVAEVYDLAGVSGKSVVDHTEAQRMMADIKRKHITGLIFSKLARLARNTRELLDFADYFRTHNADLISLQESIDTSTPAGRLFYTMIAAMAQWEREEIVERVRASVGVRAKLGHPLGGPAPFGYQWKDKKLVPHPKEAPVRKLMYDLFLEHRRKKTVVRLLNEAGHRTRKGARFTAKTVDRLLQDPTAKGDHRANYTTRDGSTRRCAIKPEDQWVTTKVEPIVTPDVWQECNHIRDQTYQQQRRPAKKPVHVFAGILECSCGGKMYVPSNSPKYVCKACRNKIAIVDLEGIFTDEIRDYSFSTERIKAYLDQADGALIEKQRLLEHQKAEAQKARTEIDRVYRLYQEGQLDPTGFGKFYKPLEERRTQLEADIPRLEAEIDTGKVETLSAEEVALQAQQLHQLWPAMEPDEKRKIVETITERIVVGKDDINITLCYLPPCKDMAKRWRKGWDSNPR